MDRATIIAQIRKLIALAQDKAATPAEAALAAERVERLLTKYKLERADVDGAAEPEAAVKGDWQTFAPSDYDVDWRRVVYKAAAFASYCHPVFQTRSRRVTFVGTPADVEIATWLAEYLVREIDRLAAARVREIGRRLHSPRAFARHFSNGAAETIRERLDARRAAREQGADGPGTALVLLNAAALARTAAYAHFPNLGRGQYQAPTFDPSRSAYGQGRSAAQGIPINTPMTSPARSAPLALPPPTLR